MPLPIVPEFATAPTTALTTAPTIIPTIAPKVTLTISGVIALATDRQRTPLTWCSPR